MANGATWPTLQVKRHKTTTTVVLEKTFFRAHHQDGINWLQHCHRILYFSRVAVYMELMSLFADGVRRFWAREKACLTEIWKLICSFCATEHCVFSRLLFGGFWHSIRDRLVHGVNGFC